MKHVSMECNVSFCLDFDRIKDLRINKNNQEWGIVIQLKNGKEFFYLTKAITSKNIDNIKKSIKK